GGLTSGFTRERPRPTDIFYGLDGDTNRANWASTNGPDRWTSQFIPEGSATNKLPEIFPVRSPAFFTAQAPAAALAAPSVEVVSDETQNDVRTLRLRVTSPRRAPVLTFAVNSDAGVTGAAVNGRPLEETLTDAELSESKRWSLRYHALPAEGFELTVRAKASQPVSVRVVDQSYGLPQLDGRATTPRPDDMVLAQLSFNDSTFVSKSFTF
ncbi:MAG TPA: hypothetical protein VEQ42_04050, partial [Pyrinomonadaceae bacterium]|nr:hypothetical protein [Pyrinomonadaceae bacterium]